MSVVRKRCEKRGVYEVNVYDVEITPDMRQTALNFATKIILGGNQYSRMLPNQVRNSNDLETKQKIEIQRTYVGKLGEMVFSKLLEAMGRKHSVGNMFTIFPGETNVDDFDFINQTGETVDIKTGFRPFHSRLMVNLDQFNNIPKDYYVGVKLNAQDVDAEIKLVDWENITLGTVQGYAEHIYMKNNVKTDNFGEGDAKALSYSQLMGIDLLLSKF